MNVSELALLNQKYKQQRNLMAVGFVVALVFSFILSLGTLRLIGTERIVVTPVSVNREFWLDTDQVSDSYLEQITDYLVHLVLNVNPSNQAYRMEQLLKQVHPEAYGRLKKSFVQQGELMQKKGMTTAFFIRTQKIDREHWVNTVSGNLKIMVGNQVAEELSKTYKISFSYQNGRLLLKEFLDVSEKT